MKAFKKSIAPAILALTCVAATADASVVGRLENVGCDVVIDRSGQLYRATEGAGLQAGDRVFANDGSSANIVLNAGCSGSLNSLQSVGFGAGNSCVDVNNVTSISSNVRDTVFAGGSCAGGVFVPTAVAGAGSSVGGFAPPWGTLAAIAGGLIVTGIAVEAFDDDDSPTSP